MQDITIRQIEIFLAVAEQLSQSGAARDLFINQSAISRWIQRLEKSLKTRLFVRTNKGMVLTPEGEFLYSEFKPLLDKLTSTLKDIQVMYNTPENILRIGCYHSNELVTELRSQLKPFEKHHLDTLIKLELYEATELYEKLLCGNLDCAVSYEIGFSIPKSLDFKRFKKTDIYFSISSSHPLIVDGRLDLKKLSNETMFLVMTPESDQSEEWKIELCRKNGFEPKHIEYLPNPFAREIAIKNKRGFSIGGTDQNCHFPDDIKLFPAVEKLDKEQCMILVWRRRSYSAMIREFINSFTDCDAIN